MNKILLLLAIAFLANLQGAYAQYQSRYNYMTVGIHLNGLNYFGDLAPKTNYFSTNLALTGMGTGADITFKIAQNVRMRSAITWGQLKGDDFSSANINNTEGSYRYARNLHFRNNIIEISQVMALRIRTF